MFKLRMLLDDTFCKNALPNEWILLFRPNDKKSIRNPVRFINVVLVPDTVLLSVPI